MVFIFKVKGFLNYFGCTVSLWQSEKFIGFTELKTQNTKNSKFPEAFFPSFFQTTVILETI